MSKAFVTNTLGEDAVDEAKWTEDYGLRGTPTTNRVLDLINLGWLYARKRLGDAEGAVPDTKDLLIDAQESHGRATRGGRMNLQNLPITTRNSEVYAYGPQRSLIAEDSTCIMYGEGWHAASLWAE